MQKLIDKILKLSLFVFLITGILGFYFLTGKQEENALHCAKIGGFASLVFTIIILGEVMTSKTIRPSRKLFWIGTLFILQILAGLGYYLTDRRYARQLSTF